MLLNSCLRRKAAVAAFAAAMVVPVSVTSASPAFAAGPQNGGTLSYYTAQDPQTFDPAHNISTVSSYGTGTYETAVYDQLVYQDAHTGDVVPQLAKSLTSNDGRVWTLGLRPNIKFTDGTPLDAAAVKFDWERHLDPAVKSTSSVLAGQIQSLDVVSPTELKITLKSPSSQFNRTVANEEALNAIPSPTAIKAAGASYGVDSAVGAGPFTIESWIRGNQMVLVRNPKYWNAPKPYLDKVIVKLMPDYAAAQWNTMSTTPNSVGWSAAIVDLVAKGKAAGMKQLTVQGSNQSLTYTLNLAKPPFDDLRMRQAINIAFDPKQWNSVIHQNTGTVNTTVFQKSSPFYDPTAKIPQYDQAKAQSLIDAYVKDHGGQPAQLVLFGSGPTVAIMEALQAMLAPYKNLNVTVRNLPSAAYVQGLQSGDFTGPLTWGNLGGVDPEPLIWDNLHTGGNRNYEKYSSPAMDAALDQGRQNVDLATRKKAYATVQKLLVQDLPMLFQPIQAPPTVFNFNGKFGNLGANLSGPLYDRIYIKSQK